MKIKLLDGENCKDFCGGWFPYMSKYVGTVISKRQDWDRSTDNIPKYAEHPRYFAVWFPNGNAYFWDKRCVEIMEGENEDE